MKKNKFFDELETRSKHSTKLKLEGMKDEFKAMETQHSSGGGVPHIHSHSSSGNKAKGGFGNAQHMGGSKGGVVVNGQTVIVKSNFSMAGRKQKDGSRATKKDVGKHASASINYMDNHGAEDIKDQDLSNVYDENGDRLTKDELNELRKEMNDNDQFSAFRRIVIDPGQQDNISREEMVQMVIKTMDDYKQKTGADFEYKIAIHTDKVEHGGNIHAHVVAYGSSRSINMTKDQMKDFKQIAGKNVKETLDNKNSLSVNQKITQQINSQISKTQQIQNNQKLTPTQNLAQIAKSQSQSNTQSQTQSHDKSLTLSQEIDKLMDGKLDNKHNEIKTSKDDISKAIESIQNKKSEGLSH